MHPQVLIRRPRHRSRGVGIAVSELCEESNFAARARRELMKWFPSSTWVAQFDGRPDLREGYLESRRRFLLGAAGLVCVPVVGCSAVSAALPIVLQLVEAAAQVFSVGGQSGGTAFFGNGSQSRERSQLLTQLIWGSTTAAYGDEQNYRDEQEFLVDVPSAVSDWSYPFEGLVSSDAGGHFIAGTAAGSTLFTDIFSYV